MKQVTVSESLNSEFIVSIEEDKKEIAHLEQVNAQLTRSLDRCRELLAECRSKLAANNNEGEAGEDSAQSAHS